MSFRFLCEEISWSKQVFLPLNVLIKATLEKKDFLNQLESLITLSVRLIREEIANYESLPNINTFVELLEEFVFNLNEIHASSDKALPDFDVKTTPLIYTFFELVGEQSRLGDCQKEFEAKVVRFLNSLPIHPTLHITPWHRTLAFVTSVNSLLSDELSEEPAIQTPEDSHNEKLVTNVNPPITETTDVSLSVKHQMENPANFPTPSRTPPLIEFQKVLRERFPTPFITQTEKKARRDVIRTLRSQRRPQLSSWNVVETRSPARSRNLRKQLFVDTDSLSKSVDLPIQSIAEATPPSQLDDRRQTASWKQVRLQIPPCWADLIGNHIKENHPDEKLWYQEEASARWPIVKTFCNCAQSKRD